MEIDRIERTVESVVESSLDGLERPLLTLELGAISQMDSVILKERRRLLGRDSDRFEQRKRLRLSR